MTKELLQWEAPGLLLESSPHSPQLEKALGWQRRPTAAKNKNEQTSIALGSGLDFIVELRRTLVVMQTHFCLNGESLGRV